MYGGNTRALPGTLAPMYQELARGKRVMSAKSLTCCTHPTSAVGVGSIVVRCCSRMWTRQALTQSTCCSIDTTMFDRTDGLPGPVMVKKFGKPLVIRPRYCFGPSAHLRASATP